jgi:uncharacterized membrane protein HdeD (DUF308 family)
MSALNLMLCGAIAMASVVAGMFFLRFWQRSRDRFFMLFALSFFVEGANRIALALSERPNEGSPLVYGVRMLSYLLIIAAVVDRNRSGEPRPRRSPFTNNCRRPPRRL